MQCPKEAMENGNKENVKAECKKTQSPVVSSGMEELCLWKKAKLNQKYGQNLLGLQESLDYDTS